ncbi:MAG TPA: iron-containing alcohol dehydrogenase [Casimicrobiaceae bacterium]|nr:iron-containing alcohol dehydrogenase [Casimicrobiaceae bacterium]
MTNQGIREFYSPTHLIFGLGAAGRTGGEAKRLGGHRVFVVTDQRVHGSGLTKAPLDSLAGAGLEVVLFADCEPDPAVDVVERALERYLGEGCDVVVVIGGGSPICLGRAVALRATNRQKNLRAMEGMNRFEVAPKPTVLVTTTTGSGSEVSPVFIITDPERMVKMNIGGRGAQATVSILDPAMLKSLPPEQVLATGMDAITHSLESFLSNRDSIITDALAIRSLKVLWENIAPAAFSVNSMESRGQMLVASIMAVQASGNARLGLVHAMSDQICAFHHVSHGMSNALMLPAVMEYNLPVVTDKFAELAHATGEHRVDEADAPEAFLSAISRLYRRLGLPTRLPEVVDSASFGDWADRTLENPLYATTIRQPTKLEIVNLYRRAKEGLNWL